MRKVSLALGVMLAALSSAASAADLPPANYGAPQIAPVRFSWTAFYIGIHGGYGRTTNSGSEYTGPFIGEQLGGNWQYNNVVLGLEVEHAYANISRSQTVGGITATAKFEGIGSARARIGYAADRVLLYGTGGFAWALGKVSASAGGLTVSTSATHTGWTVGAGIEFAFTQNWTSKLEYLYGSFGSANYVGIPSGAIEAHTFKFGLNYLIH